MTDNELIKNEPDSQAIEFMLPACSLSSASTHDLDPFERNMDAVGSRWLLIGRSVAVELSWPAERPLAAQLLQLIEHPVPER